MTFWADCFVINQIWILSVSRMLDFPVRMTLPYSIGQHEQGRVLLTQDVRTMT